MPLAIKAAELGAEAAKHFAPQAAENGLNLLKIVGKKIGVKSATVDTVNNFFSDIKGKTAIQPNPAEVSNRLKTLLKSGSDADSVLPPVSRTLGESSEYTVRGFKFNGPVQQRIEALQQGKIPVDYKSLVPKNSKVVLFGETHPINESRDELISNMKEFKEMGFTHLAMEALTKKRQPLLDAYAAGSHPNATPEAIAKVLERDWGWNTPSYVKLIDEATANGIKILSTDKKIPKSVEEAWNKAGIYGEDSRVRETQWAQILSDQIAREPDSKILMLAGKGHVGIDPTKTRYLTSLLDQKQLKPFVINLDSPAQVFGRSDLYSEAVLEGGLENERFAVPVVQSGFRPADFIVNLPPKSNTFRFLSWPVRQLTEHQYKWLPEITDKWSWHDKIVTAALT